SARGRLRRAPRRRLRHGRGRALAGLGRRPAALVGLWLPPPGAAAARRGAAADTALAGRAAARRVAGPGATRPPEPLVGPVWHAVSMTRQVGLLRGINLGARNRVAMAQLRELMEALGYTGVETLLQSGNMVFG